ncbi:MAG: hypothetical protein AAF996_03190 [Pseudomonadota bacterium]
MTSNDPPAESLERPNTSDTDAIATWAKWPIILAFGFLVLIVFVYQREKPADRVFSASGYTNAINRYVIDYLRFNPAPEGDERVVDLSAEAADNDTIWRFYKNSYLRGDIEANDPKLWVISNQSVRGIDENAHNIPLPIRSTAKWEGDVFFNANSPIKGELIGGRLDRQLLQVLPVDEFGDADAIRRENVSIAVSASPPRPANIFNLEAPNRGVVARLSMIGDAIVVNQRTSDIAIYVDGREIGQGGYQILPAGSELLIESQSGLPTIYTSLGTKGTSNTLSVYKSLLGRSHDDRLEKFTRTFVNEMDRLLSAREEGRTIRSERINELQRLNVEVTLNPDFHVDLQTQMRTLMEEIFAESHARETPTPASITVMDALSGDILALASYTVPEHLEDQLSDRLSVNQNFVNYPIGSVAKPLIGAAVLETFPSLADLQIRHDLTFDDDVPPNRIVRSVAGFDFEQQSDLGIGGGGDLDWVNYSDFVKYSSNAYAAALMIFAMSEDPVNGERVGEETITDYVLNGDELTSNYAQTPSRFPKRLFDEEGVFDVEVSTQLNWANELQSLYDININLVRQSGTESTINDPRYQKDVWKRFFESIEEIDRELLIGQKYAFRKLSPEQVSLNLNNANSIRSDLISIIIGAGQSRWSGVKVAESYARLVTSRKVRASLVADPDFELDTRIRANPNCANSVDPEIGRAADGELCDDTRRVTMRGLYGVANESGGTAYGAQLLRAQIGLARNNLDGQYFCLFSKTGTPQLSQSVRRRIDRATTALGALTLTGTDQPVLAVQYSDTPGSDGAATIEVHVAPGRDPIRANHANYIETLTSEFAANDAIARRLELAGVSPREMARHLRRYNVARTSGEREGILLIQEGVAQGRGASVSERDRIFGKSFAFVAAIYERGVEEGPPTLTETNRFCRDRSYAHMPVQAYAVAVNVPVQLPSGDRLANNLGALALRLIREEYF